MLSRTQGVPIIVFEDAKTGKSRCVNGRHVQTFIPNPFGKETLLTFANGDYVPLVDNFDALVNAFMGGRHDG